jgi:glyoxylase-like metal-dependent hydrolase (beta-lactamase superfamily II)
METRIERWRVGEVTITKIVETVAAGLPPEMLLADVTREQVRNVEWLYPSYADTAGNLNMSLHAYVVESEDRRIIVDTCVGNDKPRSMPLFDRLKTPFLERLKAAGFTPDRIDVVLCTHLHFDHVGWNTEWNGIRWAPTFPNARYLVGRVEWEHWVGLAGESADLQTVLGDSVQPVIDAGLADLVETDHRITREISLFATPGHTPGHVSVAISSGGQEAVIAGDVFHHPIQLADPFLASNFDGDRAVARATRHDFIAARSDKEALVLGTHFVTPSVGRIVRDTAGWRFVEVAATTDG